MRKNPLSWIGLGPDTVAKRRALRALDAARAGAARDGVEGIEFGSIERGGDVPCAIFACGRKRSRERGIHVNDERTSPKGRGRENARRATRERERARAMRVSRRNGGGAESEIVPYALRSWPRPMSS